MENNIVNDKNDNFLDVLNSQESLVSKADQKVLYVTTECWLAQLGPRKK